MADGTKRPSDVPTGPSLRSLAARKIVVGTAATAALATAAGIGVAAPAMTAAADTTAAPKAAAAATAGSGLNVEDTMDRTLASGLGAAPTGGAWNTWGATFSVSGGRAHLAKVAPGATARASLDAVQARDESASTVFSVPALPTTGGGWYVGMLLRRQANGDALYARVKVVPGGGAWVSTKLTTGSTSVDVGPAYALTTPLVAGRSYTLDAVATGGASTTVTVRAYPTGTTAPNWQVTGQAALNAAMATKGSLGLFAYASASGGALSVDVDSLAGRDLAAPVTTPTGTPTSASPTGTPTSASPTGTPTSASPTGTPTSASPTGTPTSASPTGTPTSASPTGTPTTDGPASTGSPDGGIGFAGDDPTTPPAPPTTPPAPPTTTPPAPPTTTPPAPPAGKPGPANTGVRPGTPLTVHTGDIVATAGQVIENLDIRGMVIARQPNVTIRNCIIRGNTGSSGRPLVDALGSSNLQIVDTEITPSVSAVSNTAGIGGQGFTLTRVDIHGTVDGLDVYGSNVAVRDSWIHDLAWFANDPAQRGGPTHNDSIQIFGGANLTVSGSVLEKTTGSVLQTSPNPAFTPITGMSWTDNWIDGGGCSLNIWAGPAGRLAPISLSGNRFGSHQTLAGCAIIAVVSATPLVMTGNVWDLDSTPVLVTRGG